MLDSAERVGKRFGLLQPIGVADVRCFMSQRPGQKIGKTPVFPLVFPYFPGKTLDSSGWLCYHRSISGVKLIGTETQHVP